MSIPPSVTETDKANSAAGMLDKVQVRRAFGRATGTYDTHAQLQRIINQHLSKLVSAQVRPTTNSTQSWRILDAGAGTGYGCKLLQDTFPSAQVIALDCAEPMLQHPGYSNESFLPQSHLLCADIEHLPLAAECIDLAWSSVALQWCNDLAHCWQEFERVLRPGGLLCCASFGPLTLTELRQAFTALDQLPHVNHFVSLEQLSQGLVQRQFEVMHQSNAAIQRPYSNLAALGKELKAIGAHNALNGRSNGLMGKQRWQKLQAAYPSRNSSGQLLATFEIVYLIARRRRV